MVNNYEIKPKYRLGKLKDLLYLIPANAILTTNQNGENYNVISIDTDVIYRITTNGTKIQTNYVDGNKHLYQSEITCTMAENSIDNHIALINTLAEAYNLRPIVEDIDGNRYLVSEEKCFEFSSEYTTSYNSSSVELKWNGSSNTPMLIFNADISGVEITDLDKRECAYIEHSVKKIRISNFVDTVINYDYSNNAVRGIINYNDEAWKSVDFIINSFNFKQNYSDNTFSTTLSFSIPLSEYKYYFHDLLTEFNLNRYILSFDTLFATYYVGATNGCAATYTIVSSEEENALNTITLTFTYISHTGFLTNLVGDKIDIDTDTSNNFKPLPPIITDPNGNNIMTYECLNQNGDAIYLVMQLTAANGTPKDEYWCLEGYQQTFNFLNIVGTYNKDYPFAQFKSIDCMIDANCKWIQKLPSNYTFKFTDEMFEATLQSTCPFRIKQIPSFVTVMPQMGNANEPIKITVRCTKDGQDPSITEPLVFTNGASDTVCNISLTKLEGFIDTGGLKIINVSAKEQTLTYNHYAGYAAYIKNLESECPWIRVIITDNKISFEINANSSLTEDRTFKYNFRNTNTNEIQEITFIQSKLYEEWRYDGEDRCDGKDLYQVLYRYLKYSVASNWERTNQSRLGELIQENAPTCMGGGSETWRPVQDSYMCIGNDKFEKLERFISTDGGQTWESTGEFKAGNLIESMSPDCNANFIWQANGNTVCLNGNLYEIEEKFYNNGETIESTGETRVGKVLEINSNKCINPEDNAIEIDIYCDGDANTTNNIFYIKSNTSFNINWGDGTTNSYLHSDFETGNYIEHKYNNAYITTNKRATIRITGGLYEVRMYPVCPIFQVEDIRLQNAPELIKFYSVDDNMEHTLSNIDLSKNVKLNTFQLKNIVGAEGIKSFTYPESNQLRNIAIGNIQTKANYTTLEAVNTLLASLPTVPTGLIDLCYTDSLKYTEEDHNKVCSATLGDLMDRGWFFNQKCCEVVGNRQYRLVDLPDEYECDNLTFTKHSIARIEYSEYTEAGWGEWIDTGKTIITGVLQYNSTDCGYVPTTIQEWRQIDSFTCDFETHISYWNEQLFESSDSGITWNPVIPEQIRQSETIRKTDDYDCGYVDPGELRYRWVVVEGEYLCDEGPENENTWQKLWAADLGWKTEEGITDRWGSDAKLKTKIPSPVNCNTIPTTASTYMFAGLTMLSECPDMKPDIEQLEDMTCMFLSTNIKTFNPLFTFNPNGIIGDEMFKNCESLTSIDFKNTKFKSMYNMLWMCRNLDVCIGLDAQYCETTKSLNIIDTTDTSYHLPYLKRLEIKNLGGKSERMTFTMRIPNLTYESMTYMIKNSGRRVDFRILATWYSDNVANAYREQEFKDLLSQYDCTATYVN